MDYQARRQAQAQDTRRAILAAAAQLTRERGFDKMSVRDICRAAGVTTGAFYHHFASKEDLLNQGFSSLDVYMENALAPYLDKPPMERLKALLRLYAQFVESQGWETLSRYYCRRLSGPVNSISPDRYTLRSMLDSLTALAEEGILSPAFTPEWTAEFFFRHFRGVVIDWIIHQGNYSLLDKLTADYQLFSTAFRA